MNWLLNLSLNVTRPQYVGMCLVIPLMSSKQLQFSEELLFHIGFFLSLSWGGTTWNRFVFAHNVQIIWASFWQISPTKCAKHARGWEVTMKKHVFSSPLPFLISSPGVSMATKSLSGGSLSADALTSIKSLSLSVSPCLWNYLHLCLTNTALFACNLT